MQVPLHPQQRMFLNLASKRKGNESFQKTFKKHFREGQNLHPFERHADTVKVARKTNKGHRQLLLSR
jgi:hypothetical protein